MEVEVGAGRERICISAPKPPHDIGAAYIRAVHMCPHPLPVAKHPQTPKTPPPQTQEKKKRTDRNSPPRRTRIPRNS
jgi:hypothetical protein